MKNHIKKIAALLFSFCILCGTLPAVSAATQIAEKGVFAGNLTYTINDYGTLTISGSGAIPDYDPDAEPFPWRTTTKSITKIRIENGITEIGNHAFSGCTEVSEVEILDSVKRIGDYAFKDCTSLDTVEIYSKDCEIGADPFPSGVRLYCYKDSTTETYAKSKWGITFTNFGVVTDHPDAECVYCGKVHDKNFPGDLVRLFHRFFYFLKIMFG
ncbi:MAG: leucine-rich repeat protein [Clostridia bacterium]|nr:leucine-rich repeat protein [Clostridia bacterium]